MFKKKSLAKNVRKTTNTFVIQEEQVNVIKRADLISLNKKVELIHGFRSSKKDSDKESSSTINRPQAEINSHSAKKNHVAFTDFTKTPKDLPFSSLIIDSEATSGIPTNAEIYLLKKKRAELSKKLNSEISAENYISLGSYNNHASKLAELANPSSATAFSDQENEHLEYKTSGQQLDFETYSLNKLQRLNKTTNDEDGYDYEHMEVDDIVDNLDDNPTIEVDDNLINIPLDEINNASKKAQNLGALNSFYGGYISGDEEDSSAWEFERLKNSGVDLKLLLKNNLSYVQQNSNYNDLALDNTFSNAKIQTPFNSISIPIPNEILEFIEQIYKNKQLDIAENQSKIEKLNLAIGDAKTNITNINLDVEKTNIQIEKFKQILSDSITN
ncbi:hypothetical protein BB561_006284 [Smittium simulii]|uniref:Uncharacterized protein n=1 Tax=Smittium simulii TaxID=133385 RepID=A0A2T9Y5K2_9FUNG|nr:hypothetical protein BB561_006284 [Smittium simulii]